MNIVINQVNRTYSFKYTHREPIKIELYKDSSSLDLQTMGFAYPEGYSGTVIVKTKNRGDYFLTLHEKQGSTNVNIDFSNFADDNHRNEDVNYAIIEEIEVLMKFNLASKNQIPSHVTNISFDIQ